MSKNLWGLLVVCIGLMGVFFFRITMKYVKNVDIINEKLFDLKLITADDYSIKVKVTEAMVTKFK
jgi:hypothetical protein